VQKHVLPFSDNFFACKKKSPTDKICGAFERDNTSLLKEVKLEADQL